MVGGSRQYLFCVFSSGENLYCGRKCFSGMQILVLFYFYFFNWRIIDLQCCIVFCHITRWINPKDTYVPFLLNLSPIFYPIPPLQVVIGYWAELCYRATSHQISFARGNVKDSVLLSQLSPPSLSPAVLTSLFSMSASLFLPWKQIHQY